MQYILNTHNIHHEHNVLCIQCERNISNIIPEPIVVCGDCIKYLKEVHVGQSVLLENNEHKIGECGSNIEYCSASTCDTFVIDTDTHTIKLRLTSKL